MSFMINHNLRAMTGHRHLLGLQQSIKTSLERLSSGYRINRAADDAAGLAIRSRLRADIASCRQCTKNASQSISMVQVAEGALATIDAVLLRMKELAVQAGSANSSSNLDKLDAEFQSLYDEIDRISKSTRYADTILLDGSLSGQGMQIHVGPGTSDDDNLTFEIGDATLTGLGLRTLEKAGSEFLVNSYKTSNQTNPSVTALSDGGFVVTWVSTDQDGSSDGIYGQRYDESGNMIGSEFKVNTTIADSQKLSSVTNLDGGGFVVTWQSRDQDGDDYGIYGQMYDVNGSAVGSEFQVNTYTSGYQAYPSVADLSDGGFVVTWIDEEQDESGAGIYGQRYDSSGTEVGSEFRVNSYTPGTQWSPSVTGLSDGGFVVTWESSGQDGSGKGVYGQRYGSSGNVIGSEFKVNTETTSDQLDASVTALSDGGFLVTWQSLNQDGSGYGVYGQRYDDSGNEVDSEFQINSYTASSQYNPSVTALSNGGFAVTWQSNGQDGSGEGVYLQRYDRFGNLVGSESQVNEYTSSSQINPSITTLTDDGLVITWQSNGQDGSGYGIYGQLYKYDHASLSSTTYAREAMNTIDNAVSNIQALRADLGAVQSRLEYTISELNNRIENLQAAESVISDTDMAG
jgi:flagellin-like hook-associated protein FlgL